MNSETGAIRSLQEVAGLSETEQAKFFPIDEQDMTSKQKRLMHVSRRDTRSTLGRLRIERRGSFRNKPCPCGSGRKFKKCCWNKVA